MKAHEQWRASLPGDPISPHAPMSKQDVGCGWLQTQPAIGAGGLLCAE